jgi:hypothetical protein
VAPVVALADTDPNTDTDSYTHTHTHADADANADANTDADTGQAPSSWPVWLAVRADVDPRVGRPRQPDRRAQIGHREGEA